MTPEELKDLIGKKRLTKKLALELSIKKWKELPKYASLKAFRITFNDGHYPNGDNCALCKLYICENTICPLNNEKYCWGLCHNEYAMATKARTWKDFMQHRRNLIKIMQKELDKCQKN